MDQLAQFNARVSHPWARCCRLVAASTALVAAWAAVLAATGAAGAETRTWTSSDGKYTVQAELLRADAGSVTLKTTDGRVITVPLGRLSAEDRQYVAKAQAAAGQRGPTAAAQATAALRAKGILVGSTGLSLSEETKLAKGLRGMLPLRRQLIQAKENLAAANNRLGELKRQVVKLTQSNVQLNARLARIGPNDVLLNNQLVGAINANNNQIRLLQQAIEQQQRVVDSARAAVDRARETYVQHVLDLRALADKISAQYEQLAADSQVRSMVQQLAQATAKPYDLTPSPTFRGLLRKLQSVEQTVLTESIPLRSDGSGTFTVTAVFEGNRTCQMVVDSGASLVSLPAATAQQLNIQIDEKAPEVQLHVADGRRISGRLVTLPSVRVGQFTAENVACVVLGPEAGDAPALLGMSFLGNFKFQINAAAKTLTLTKVETSGSR